ncbi:MAG TPA: hypothetical protein DDZ67_07705 [Xanthomonadaceae bacterium]|nr:hypothetical protein [Xanthomonadaceae bacterium]
MIPVYISPEASRLCRRWGRHDGDLLPEAVEESLRSRLRSPLDAGADPLALHGGMLTVRHRERPQLSLRLEISAPLQLAGGRRHYIVTMVADGDDEASALALSPRTLTLLQRLSPSERKVAALVARGLRNEAIAQQLCRSRKTVESQISSIYRKLDVESRAQLVRLLN